MNKRVVFFAFPAAVVIALAVIMMVKAGDPLKLLKPDPAFKEYINAYTSGVISAQSPVRVQLTHPFADSAMIGQPADPALFSFSPGVEGTVKWTDSRTIEFMPSAPMEANTTYTCTFRLLSLMQVPELFREFVFQFHTIRQDYEVRLFSPVAFNDTQDLYSVSGYVSTADKAGLKEVKGMLGARFDGAKMMITWPDQSDGTRFQFRIDSIARRKESMPLTVEHQGAPIDVRNKGEVSVTITGTGEFSVLDAEVVHEPDQCVVITFSDLLDSETDYDGLIRIGNLRNLRFTVDGNRLKVYPNYSRSGEMTLIVEPAVTNSNGKRLGKPFTRSINFESMKPAVRMVGEGTVLPSTNGLLFPFEAVNLNAVDVKIQKIYEKNVPQFLQVNDLGGSDEMYRVAATVYDKKLDLSQTTGSVSDYSQWSRYALDLSTLISPERGAIYRVVLSFRMEYSTYPCGGNTGKDEFPLTRVDPVAEEEESDEDDSWDYMGDYEYEWYGYDDYDWDERNDPCKRSYYYYRSVSKNILSSDIGLIAKAGSDGELICFTTDIITAMPISGMEVQVMDFQMQILATGKSDAEGKIVFPLKKKPFLVIARRGDERGYLKLGEGNALSMSLFDVDGEKVRRGVKGFLYAERGVWRPGDTMFIHFILENKQRQLPDDVPVMFELSDPQGNVVRRKVATSSVKGIYPFHVWTDESSLTGNYLGKVYIGNLTFSRYFKVETVKPNRLKIDLRFPGDRIKAGSDQPGTLEARWLHGAAAPGLKADVSMTLEKGVTKFTGFEPFSFDDPAANFFTETTVVFEGKLDQAGRAAIDPGIELEENAPGVLKASFRTKVFEAGGDFSINTITVPYYPFSSYAGLWAPAGSGWWDMLESGKNHQFRVANVTGEGKGLTTKLNVEIYKIDWSWWWHNTERGLPYFLSNTEAVPVYTASVAVSAGRGHFTWGVGAESWGRYFIRVTDPESGHSTGKVVYFDYPGWGRRPGQGREGASMLTVSTDKPRYKVGEMVNVTIPSSLAGRALVSLETGSSVLRTEWIKADSGVTRFNFPVTAGMAPNVYIHITLLQPHRQTVNDMPIRMYGVVHVLVDDPATHLKPEIAMPATWEAESDVSVTVSEQQGKPMAYTLAIVDEGLLDLTGFKTPDPWNHFYGKEALGVKTWDIFSEVIGAMAGGFERLLSIGGGDTRINYDKQKTRRFTPVVKTFGPVFLEPGQKKTHRFRMPQYVGSVRVMVVAAYEGAYGNAEKTAQVKSPLMVLGTLPRVAGPGETLELPVNVFAMEKEIKEVQVKVVPSGLFEIVGASAKSLTFSAPGDQVTHFSLKVKNQVGKASVDILVTSGQKTARHTISLEVRNPNPPQVRVLEKTIAAGQSWSDELILNGMTGTNEADIELSSIPPLNLAKRLEYLIRYPHGCLEQTVSAAFPQLLLRDVIHLDKASMKETDMHIRAAIEKMGNYMMNDGSLSYWPNGNYYNAWSSSYAGHFLIEAEKRGFTLPQGMKKQWISAQRQIANNWQQSMTYRQDDLVQAYRLYTLALAGAPEMGAMNRLRGLARLTNQARWRLAAAYALAGKPRTAQNLIEGITAEVPAYTEYGYTFGSPLRDKALAVETMVLLRNMDGAAPVVRDLVNALNNESWYNTQATAFALIALSQYYSQQKPGSGLACETQYNGKKNVVNTPKAVFTEKITGLENGGTKKLTVKNNSGAPLFVKVIQRGTPLPGNETPSSKKLVMKIEYLATSGQTLDPSKITQGKDFIAKITVTNTGSDWIQELALTHIIPSGWQILNNRLTEVPDARLGSDPHINYQDIRDDRVLTYFNIGPGKAKTFQVMLNATYTGRFYLPPLLCEAMYTQDAYARSEGKWVDVVR